MRYTDNNNNCHACLEYKIIGTNVTFGYRRLYWTIGEYKFNILVQIVAVKGNTMFVIVLLGFVYFLYA